MKKGMQIQFPFKGFGDEQLALIVETAVWSVAHNAKNV
jgi:hypothetical protein